MAFFQRPAFSEVLAGELSFPAAGLDRHVADDAIFLG